MAADEIRIVVRRPLAEIEREVRANARVVGSLIDVSIEKDALVFAFAPADSGEVLVAPGQTPRPPKGYLSDTPHSVERIRRRRKRRVRRRTKTRGWPIVAKFTNSRGQSCAVYAPMFDALSSDRLSRREAFGVIREILESNGNDPSRSSVDYYLQNTLEYIAKTKGERSSKE